MKLHELAEALAERGIGNQLDGDPNIRIHGVSTLADAAAGEISFLSNPKYTAQLEQTRATAVIVPTDAKLPQGLSAIRCQSPYSAMATATILIHGYRQHPQWGLDSRSEIAVTARIGPNANIGPFVTISRNVEIGANATIYPGCYIGDNACIGNDVILYPNVVIYDDSRIGNRVALHAGTVIGEDGLGYASVGESWLKIPQVGRVVIEDDVEMGAGCTLDRATLGETRIGSGTKFSDQVVIGHGCKVGNNCMIVAQVGIAGSVTVGNRVTLGGQVGIAGHLSIGDNAVVNAKSAVWASVEANQTVLGSPATEARRWQRQAANIRKLPDMRKRIRQLEAEVAELRKRLTDEPGNGG
jgi:UDP-3-O-[3-hydroxymyristoyl] glucosamine N-acyltransferase